MFRFTIRDLLWVTVVVALGVAWWIDRRQMRNQLDEANKWRTRAGGLEYVLRREFGNVRWVPGGVEVHAKTHWYTLDETKHEPSQPTTEYNSEAEEMERPWRTVPNPSAPASNPPKD
jgi:hypothetical protein